MTYPRPTLETIYSRIKADMEGYVTEGVPIPRRSLLGILALIFAGAIHLSYGFLVWMARQLFVDTASGEGLERWGRIYNLPRKAAQYTTGYVKFTGTASTVVASGTGLVNGEGKEYETEAAFTIGTSASVSVVAVEPGAASNTREDTLTLSSPDANVASVVTIVNADGTAPATVGFDNGVNLETDEAWTLRLLQRSRNPLGCGNPGDYIRWALEVPGVDRAWCVPSEIWANGAGRVAVFVARINTEGDLASVSASVLLDVGTYIEGIRPIPALVEYFTVDEIPVYFRISVTPNNPDMRSAIDAQLRLMFNTETEPGGTILLSHMRRAIGAAGPDDYEITSLTVGFSEVYDPPEDVTRNYPEILRFNGSTYTDLT
jgi:uncharacterized phage protein gp47/JayE